MAEMAGDSTNVLQCIQSCFPRLSKGQKRIAQFITREFDRAAFMTAAKLGGEVGVSESTVVRFANALGFQGYPELQTAMQEIIKNKLTTVQRVEMSSQYTNERDILTNTLKSDLENIRSTLDIADSAVFQSVIEEIFAARTIYIVGLRSSTALAQYLGFYLNLVLDNVKVVGYGISDIFEQLLRVSAGDVVIGISFPRYSKRTIEAIRYAREEGARIVGITDSMVSPIAEISHLTLTARSNMVSFVDSLVAPMSLINALIIAVGMGKRSETRDYFEKLENIWTRYSVYNVSGKG